MLFQFVLFDQELSMTLDQTNIPTRTLPFRICNYSLEEKKPALASDNISAEEKSNSTQFKFFPFWP